MVRSLIQYRDGSGLLKPKRKIISCHAHAHWITERSCEIKPDGRTWQAAHFHELYRQFFVREPGNYCYFAGAHLRHSLRHAGLFRLILNKANIEGVKVACNDLWQFWPPRRRFVRNGYRKSAFTFIQTYTAFPNVDFESFVKSIGDEPQVQLNSCLPLRGRSGFLFHFSLKHYDRPER